MEEGIFSKCEHCGEWTLTSCKNRLNGLCRVCYYHTELYECETCGREITKFDYDDFNGECGYCHDGC